MLSHHPELERSFHERYWAAQNRHMAAALVYRTRLLRERTKRALEHSRQLVQREHYHSEVTTTSKQEQ